METVPQVPGNKPQPGSAYVKIDITRSAVDADGAVKTAKPKDVFVTDRQGRTWVALVGDDTTPAEKMEIGEPYQMTAYARVPARTGGRGRTAAHTEQLPLGHPHGQAHDAKTEPDLDVLRFKR